MERVDGALGNLRHKAVKDRKGRGPVPLHHVPVGDENDMLLAESLPRIVALLLLDHLRRLVGIMDLEDPFEFRHPVLSPSGTVEKLQPPKHPLPKPAGNLKDGPGIVRNLIIIGSFSGRALSLVHVIPSLHSTHCRYPCGGLNTILRVSSTPYHLKGGLAHKVRISRIRHFMRP